MAQADACDRRCDHQADELVAIQRIFLRDDGSDKRWRKPRKSKFSLGRLLGGALRLDHSIEGSEVILTEGPEDALTLMQEMPGRVLFDQLVVDISPDRGPNWLDRLLTGDGNADDWGRLSAALNTLAECAGVRRVEARCA